MNLRYLFSISLLLIIGTSCLQGQEKTVPLARNEIGILPVRYEMNTVTANHRVWSLKGMWGAYFNRTLPKIAWTWTSSLSFANNSIDDDCSTCWDHVSGIGQLREILIGSGIRYTFLKKRNFPLKPFVQIEGNLAFTHYKANLMGGYDGQGLNIDWLHYGFGFMQKAGIEMCVARERIVLNALCGMRLNWGTSQSRIPDGFEGYHLLGALTAIEGRIGYRF